MYEILKFFPKNISETLYQNINGRFSSLEEIRLRVEKPIILKFSNQEIVIKYIISRRRNTKNPTNDM